MRTERRGSLEVHYIGERLESTGSPFLEEERRLIKAIAEKLGRILWVKTVEKNMRESEQRYRLLAEQVEDGVTLPQDGRFLFANRAFTKLFDLDGPEEVMGKPLDEVLENQSIEGLGDIYRSTANGKCDTSFRKPCGTRSGREVWVEGYHGMTQYKDRPAVLSTLRDITERVLREKAIQEEANLLREENINLRTSMKERYRFGNIIGKSAPMQEVYELILKAAHSDVSVAVLGESGTGKELVARAIHSLSARRGGEFVTVNCGAIPEALLESEFFGHKKGAFTSAHADKIGYLDIANGGSLQGMGRVDESRKPLQHAIQDLEKSTILKALDQTRWNRSRTAELLGISRRALYRKMKRPELE